MLLTLFLISLSTAPALVSERVSQYRDLCSPKLLSVGSNGSLHKVSIHRQNLGIVFDLAANLMDVEWTEMGAELALSFGSNVCKVLVAEDDDPALGGEECQFIFLLRSEAAELDATNLRADGRGQFFDNGARSLKKRFLLRVGTQTYVDVLEFL